MREPRTEQHAYYVLSQPHDELQNQAEAEYLQRWAARHQVQRVARAPSGHWIAALLRRIWSWC